MLLSISKSRPLSSNQLVFTINIAHHIDCKLDTILIGNSPHPPHISTFVHKLIILNQISVVWFYEKRGPSNVSEESTPNLRHIYFIYKNTIRLMWIVQIQACKQEYWGCTELQAFKIIIRYFLMNSLSKRVNSSSSIRRSWDASLSSTSRLKALARAMRASSFLLSKETPGKSSYERLREERWPVKL